MNQTGLGPAVLFISYFTLGELPGIPCFIALYLIAHGRYSVFYKMKVCATLHRASLLAQFFQQHLEMLSVTHFGNSQNISNFFIIIMFAMIICDL